MNSTKCEVVRGIYGEYYVRRKISEGRYEFFAGYDENGRAVWDSFDVDFDLDEKTAYKVRDALNA